MVDYADRIEVWTSYLLYTDPIVYFSGRRIKAGGKEYAIVRTKNGQTVRGIDGGLVEEFPTRSQPAQALEREFQRELANGNIEGEIMEREMRNA